ncbi:DUF6963 family protein [Rhodospirillaceae bacterium SYSU D60014]|uniref:DUF6963 family protein n=1 Tax=Virgifigura deserti TaxID=2268457 RepID=UPI000E670A15
MTIGIAATGPDAGLAIFRALQATEQVAAGSIRGFAAIAVLTRDGKLLRAETQRGGSTTLFTAGEMTGVEPPTEVAAAPIAGLISSGPDRVCPLSEFIAAKPGVGIVTGHRLPNGRTTDGPPYNEASLNAMARGATPEQAVRHVLAAHPSGDVGLIAVAASGGIFAADTERVARRPDVAAARRKGPGNASVAVLLNAIRPAASVAALAADIALDTMGAAPQVEGRLTVAAGTPVVAGPRDMVEVDDNLAALRIITSDAALATGRHVCAIVYLGAEVRQDGRLLGRTLVEPNSLVENGRLVSVNSQALIEIAYTGS